MYRIPLPYADLDYYFTYAGKAHPELALHDNEIIITYVVRSNHRHHSLHSTGSCFRKFVFL